MCKVNSGEKIQNRQDVQNLVTAIIFRQSGEYRNEIYAPLPLKVLSAQYCNAYN